MNLLLISRIKKAMLYRESNFLPRVGDWVDEFYQPYPVVQQVVLWPSIATLRSYEEQEWDYRLGFCESQDLKSLAVDALVLVD